MLSGHGLGLDSIFDGGKDVIDGGDLVGEMASILVVRVELGLL